MSQSPFNSVLQTDNKTNKQTNQTHFWGRLSFCHGFATHPQRLSVILGLSGCNYNSVGIQKANV